MKYILLLLLSLNAFAIPITNDSILDADQLSVLNSSEITMNNNLDANANNIFGIADLTATGTTTLNVSLTGFLKAVSGVVSAQALIVLTTEVSGVLPIANGGTGSATKNFVDLTTAQTVAGVKTFASPIINTGISGTAIDTDTALTANSDTILASQKAVKAYVDASAGSPTFTTVTKTTTATLATTGEDNVVVDASGGDFTVTLPAVSGNSGLTYKLSSKSTGTTTIEGNASETIGGELNVRLASKDDSIIITTDGVAWFYLSDDVVYTARYTSNNGLPSINSSVVTIMDFEDLDNDTHGAVTIGAAWKFTSVIDAYYLVKTSVTFVNLNVSAGDSLGGLLYKGGSAYKSEWREFDTANGAHYTTISVNDVVHLNQGEYIDYRLFQDTGGAESPDATGTRNTISISRIK